MAFQLQSAPMRKLFLGLTIVALSIAQCGCASNGPNPPVSYGEDYLLNTYCSITIYEKGKEALIGEALSYARTLENLLSRTIKTSEIGMFNSMESTEALEVSKDTADVLEAGLYYGEISDGLFDITIGTLTELWNFSALEPTVPKQSAIEEALLHVNYKTIELDLKGDSYFLSKKDASSRIDLGGIAKGYIADRVYDFLKEKEVSSGIINFGGNILTIGQKQDGSLWKIGLEKPFSANEGEGLASREVVGTISLEGGSIVTSGSYERKFIENGKLYYHILDPQTGYPRATNLISVTIIGPSSTDCDALSTVCLMLGLEKGRSLIESLEDYEAVFITDTEEIFSTEGAGFSGYQI